MKKKIFKICRCQISSKKNYIKFNSSLYKQQSKFYSIDGKKKLKEKKKKKINNIEKIDLFKRNEKFKDKSSQLLSILKEKEKPKNKKMEEKEDFMKYRQLAFIYERGKGVEKNMEKAVEFYKKAADLGDAYSVRQLAYFYLNGINGLKTDLNQALYFYEKASSKNFLFYFFILYFYYFIIFIFYIFLFFYFLIFFNFLYYFILFLFVIYFIFILFHILMFFNFYFIFFFAFIMFFNFYFFWFDRNGRFHGKFCSGKNLFARRKRSKRGH